MSEADNSPYNDNVHKALACLLVRDENGRRQPISAAAATTLLAAIKTSENQGQGVGARVVPVEALTACGLSLDKFERIGFTFTQGTLTAPGDFWAPNGENALDVALRILTDPTLKPRLDEQFGMAQMGSAATR